MKGLKFAIFAVLCFWTIASLANHKLPSNNLIFSSEDETKAVVSPSLDTSKDLDIKFRVNRGEYEINFAQNKAAFEEFVQWYYSLLKELALPIDISYLGTNGSISSNKSESNNLNSASKQFSTPSLILNLIDSVVVVSGASPEGPLKRNVVLSNMRSRALIDELSEYGINLPSNTVVDSRGVDWEGFRQLIPELSYLTRKQKEDILKILDSTSDNNKRISKIKALDNSYTWKLLLKNCFPQLRCAKIKITFKPEIKYLKLSYSDKFIAEAKEEAGPRLSKRKEPVEEEIPQKTGYEFALKTNILCDALTLLNVGVEFPLGRSGFSLALNHQFPWWRWGPYGNKYCIQDVQTSAELRYYFNRANSDFKQHDAQHAKAVTNQSSHYLNTGHYVGLYAYGGMWDFELARAICYQGEVLSAGLSYGYAKKINDKLNIEFSLSVGYAYIPYRHYVPTPDYSTLLIDPDKRGNWHYIGPTKANISLIWPIKVGGAKR